MSTLAPSVPEIRKRKATWRARIVLPREHGSWALWLVPFFLGIVMTHFRAAHVLLFVGTFFAFCASTPAMLWVKQPRRARFYALWCAIYLGLSLLSVVWILPQYPSLLIIAACTIPFFLINVLFIRAKNERHLLNDLSGIIGLNLVILATYDVGAGHLSSAPYWVMFVMALFFFGSALHVKSMIRERKDPISKIVAFGYHLFLIIAYAALGVSWLLVIVTVIAFARVILQVQNTKLTVATIGMLEIALSIIYFLFYAMALKPTLGPLFMTVFWAAVLTVFFNMLIGQYKTLAPKFLSPVFMVVPMAVWVILVFSLHIFYIWLPVMWFCVAAGQIFGAKLASLLARRLATQGGAEQHG